MQTLIDPMDIKVQATFIAVLEFTDPFQWELPMHKAQIVADCQNQHGEGVFWDTSTGLLWWTDIEARTIWSLDPSTAKTTFHLMPDRVCCFAPRVHGGWIVAFAKHVAFYRMEARTIERIFEFEPTNPGTRLNDGRTDRSGRFIVGGVNEASKARDSTVIQIDENGTVRTLIEGVSCSNSICFSIDGKTMYFCDTPERAIRAYAYDSNNGRLGDMRIHVDFSGEPGLPDGSCVDSEGFVWTAEWKGGRVVRTSPAGLIDRVIEVSAWKPTCCAFGGDNLDTLYITSSRHRSTVAELANDPTAGSLFAVKPGVRGIVDTPFAG